MGSKSYIYCSLSLLVPVLTSCVAPLDVKRDAPERGSVGQELYGLLCDRIGAQSLREDVTGASYQALCHADEGGEYAASLDTAALPALRADAVDTEGRPVPLERQQQRRDYAVARERQCTHSLQARNCAARGLRNVSLDRRGRIGHRGVS